MKHEVNVNRFQDDLSNTCDIGLISNIGYDAVIQCLEQQIETLRKEKAEMERKVA